LALTTRYGWLRHVRPAFLASALKRLLRIRRCVAATAEGRFFLDPASHFGYALLSAPGLEPDMVAVLKALLRPGDVFLDVGANEGYFSVIASRLVGAAGHVISVEPQGRLHGVLIRNIAENQAYNMHLCQLAIAGRSGMASLALAPDMNTGASGLIRMTRYRTPVELVPQVTLRELFDRFALRRVRLLKMDIEGSEYDAILGSPSVFQDGLIENLALELHPEALQRQGRTADEILAFLAEHGYRPAPRFSNLVLTRCP